MTYKSFFIAALLLSLMPLTVGAQGTDNNSRDLRGQVVYQDDEVVFRQLDEHTWIGNGHPERIERYMKQNDIRFLFPGHYSGDNLETLQRVTDIKNMCREILDGERKPAVSNGNNGGMDMMVDDKGVRINFSSHSGMK